jgi:hypothetical protein
MSHYCEKILARARTYIGRESPLQWGKYPVEYEPIRRWCHMVELNNPLYLDPDYARNTKWGEVVCPPPMVPIFASAGVPSPISSSGPAIDWPPQTDHDRETLAAMDLQPPTAGNRTINLGSDLEFFKVVRVGDRLGFKNRVADVYIKPIRIDPEAFWVATDTVYLNQDQEVVAVNHGLRIRHRDPDQIAATTPEQVAMLPARPA